MQSNMQALDPIKACSCSGWGRFGNTGWAVLSLQMAIYNYPPLFLWIMGLYGDLLAALGISTYAGAISFKFLLILIDLAAILLAVKLTESMSNYNWRSFVLVLFALNPALMTDSAVWGQVDMLHSMLMLLTVVLLSNRPFMSGIIFALALLTKFQAITILPVIGIWLLIVLRRERKIPSSSDVDNRLCLSLDCDA